QSMKFLFYIHFAAVLYFVSCQLKMYSVFKSQGQFAHWNGLSSYLVMQCFAFGTHVALHLGIQALVTLAIFGILILWISYERLRQVSYGLCDQGASPVKYRIGR